MARKKEWVCNKSKIACEAFIKRTLNTHMILVFNYTAVIHLVTKRTYTIEKVRLVFLPSSVPCTRILRGA